MGTSVKGLAEQEIARVNWSAYRDIEGNAPQTGPALLRLLNATTEAEAEAAYQTLDNRIVVQGAAYQAAEPSVSVLVAALAEPRPLVVRVKILDLLYQILGGEPSKDEVDLGNHDLVERCRARAREGYWVLMQQAASGLRDAAVDVLEQLPDEQGRLKTF